MNKELNIIEAVNMPAGTEFEMFSKSGIKETQKVIVSEVLGLHKLIWEDGKEVKAYGYTMNAKFVPIQKPLTFMEAVKSGGEIRIEHELIDKYKPLMNTNYLNDDYLELCCNTLTKGGYLEISDLLCALGYLFGNEKVSKILTEGKFYIEEV